MDSLIEFETETPLKNIETVICIAQDIYKYKDWNYEKKKKYHIFKIDINNISTKELINTIYSDIIHKTKKYLTSYSVDYFNKFIILQISF